jgi:hypothetical protein
MSAEKPERANLPNEIEPTKEEKEAPLERLNEEEAQRADRHHHPERKAG